MENCPFIVGLPIKIGDVPVRYVSLPEGHLTHSPLSRNFGHTIKRASANVSRIRGEGGTSNPQVLRPWHDMWGKNANGSKGILQSIEVTENTSKNLPNTDQNISRYPHVTDLNTSSTFIVPLFKGFQVFAHGDRSIVFRQGSNSDGHASARKGQF
jgi:hypothetical protein